MVVSRKNLEQNGVSLSRLDKDYALRLVLKKNSSWRVIEVKTFSSSRRCLKLIRGGISLGGQANLPRTMSLFESLVMKVLCCYSKHMYSSSLKGE